jgi:hypothetical protein
MTEAVPVSEGAVACAVTCPESDVVRPSTGATTESRPIP